MQMTAQRKLVTSVAAAAMVIGLAACGESSDQGASGEGATDQASAEQPQGSGGESPGQGQQQMPEPDLGDVPDVVAEVNGEDISGEEYSSAYEALFGQMAMQAQMSGEEVDEEAVQEQTVNNLVGYELLTQEAQDKGYEANDDDVQAELESTAEANGLESVDELFEMAEEQDVGEDQLREDVQQQVLINQVVDDLDVEEPTDEEVEEAYEQFTSQQQSSEGEGSGGNGEGSEGEDGDEAETPDLEEMRPQIEEQLATQKENQAVTAHMEDLREDAEVEIHV